MTSMSIYSVTELNYQLISDQLWFFRGTLTCQNGGKNILCEKPSALGAIKIQELSLKLPGTMYENFRLKI